MRAVFMSNGKSGNSRILVSIANADVPPHRQSAKAEYL